MQPIPYNFQSHQLPIFKLTRLLTFPKAKLSSNGDTVSRNQSITSVVTAGDANMNFIAIVVNSEQVYLRFVKDNSIPILKLLPLPAISSDIPIVSVCFNESGLWLIILYSDCTVCVVPSLLFCTREKECRKLPNNGFLILKSKSKLSKAISCAYWKPKDKSGEFVIIGCHNGSILILNLINGDEIIPFKIKAGIKRIELLSDNSDNCIYILIFAFDDKYYRISIEGKDKSILNKKSSDNSNEFEFEELLNLNSSEVLTSPYGILSYREGEVNVFMNINEYPIFTVSLPFQHHLGLYTQKITFSFVGDENGNNERIAVVSNICAGKKDALKNDSILQWLQCAKTEHICGFIKDFHIDTSNQIEGALVWTDKSIYQIAQNVDPNELFFALLNKNLMSEAEILGKTLSLSLLQLYRKAGDSCFESKDYIKAYKLYNLSDLSNAELFLKMAKANQFELIKQNLLETVKNCDMFPKTMRIYYADALLLCLVYNLLSLKKYKFHNTNRIVNNIQDPKSSPETTPELNKRRIKKNSFLQNNYTSPFRRVSETKDTNDFKSSPSVFFSSSFSNAQVNSIVSPNVSLYFNNDFFSDSPGMFEVNENDLLFKNSRKEFREFLTDNKLYSLDKAFELFLKFKTLFSSEILIAAHSRGKMKECLELMVNSGISKLTKNQLKFLLNKGYSKEIKATPRLFLSLPAQIQVKLILSDINNLHFYLRYLIIILPKLDEQSLLDIAEYFDPIGPQMTFLLNSSPFDNMVDSFSQNNESNNIPVCRNEYLDVCICALIYYQALTQRNSIPLQEKIENNSDSDSSSDLSDGEMQKAENAVDESLNFIIASPLQKSRVSKIACGYYHVIILAESGEVYGLGSNADGQLGISIEHCQNPVLIDALQQVPVKNVYCGGNHSFALTRGGGVWCWGNNNDGQLGLGIISKKVTTPHVVSALRHTSIIQIAAGSAHSLFINERGTIFSCGLNANGQLGRKIEAELHSTDNHSDEKENHSCSSTPSPLVLTKKFSFVCTGHSHSLAITENGDLYSWGLGSSGQLGHGNKDDQHFPQLVKSLQGKRILTASCGLYHSIAITELLSVYTWGSGGSAQLGIGQTVDASTPQLIPHLINKSVKAISAGLWHSAAMTENGSIQTWGRSDYGSLGQKDTLVSTEPASINKIPKGLTCKSLSCGKFFTAAVMEDGQMFIWGKIDDNTNDNYDYLSIELPPSERKQLPAKNEPYKTKIHDFRTSNLTNSLNDLLESHYGEFRMSTVLSAAFYAKHYKVLEKLFELANDILSVFSVRLFYIRQLFANHDSDDVLNENLSPSSDGQNGTLPPLVSPSSSFSSVHQSFNSPSPSISMFDAEAKYCLNSLDEMLVKAPEDQRHNILYLALKYWKERKFSVSAFENYIQSHLELFSHPLTVILASSAKDLFNSKVSESIFSRAFDILNKNMKIDFESEDDILPIHISHDIRLAAVVSELENQSDRSTSKIQKGLWDNITSNIEKKLGTRDKVIITPYFSHDSSVTQHSKDVVVFTCGHYISIKELNNFFIPQIKELLESAPISASLLINAYKSGQFIPFACPSCVISSFIKPSLEKYSKSSPKNEDFPLRNTIHSSINVGIARAPSRITRRMHENMRPSFKTVIK